MTPPRRELARRWAVVCRVPKREWPRYHSRQAAREDAARLNVMACGPHRVVRLAARTKSATRRGRGKTVRR